MTSLVFPIFSGSCLGLSETIISLLSLLIFEIREPLRIDLDKAGCAVKYSPLPESYNSFF